MSERLTYEVEVTITFSTNITFDTMANETEPTKADALANFYGCGLSALFDSGEYAFSVSHVSVKVPETDADGGPYWIPFDGREEP